MRAPGRPRSAAADRAILEAALHLLAEDGYAGLTMERVRERSGVGKATLYRRYRSKQELAKAAVVHLNDGFDVPEDTGSLTGDFAALVRTVLALAEGTGALDVMPRLLSDVAGDEEMHELFTEHLVEPRRRVVRTLIERAIERGEVRRDIDPELAVDMIAGPMIYRVITSGGKIERLGNPLDVLHAALEGLRPR